MVNFHTFDSNLNMELKDKIGELSEKHYNEIVNHREWFHQHPETAFKEFKTANYIQKFLEKHGIEYDSGIAKTGIVGYLKGQKSGDAVLAIRADMDALEIQEDSDVPYKSLHEGMMHACGHDVHMSSLMGAILLLNQLKAYFGGTIKLIFQPSEEKNPGGASVMIEEGVLENPKVNSIFAQHVFPDLQAGKVGFRAGKYMASADEIYLEVQAKGGHGGMPDRIVDTVLTASHIIISLQHIVSRNNNPFNPTVLSFGRFIADGQTNIIPDTVKIAGTMRTFDEDWRQEMYRKIEKIAQNTAESMGAKCHVNISRGYPVVYNEPEMTKRFIKNAVDLLGKENVVELERRTTGEDFGFFTQKLPACFYRLGTAYSNEKKLKKLHTSNFDINPESLKTSVALMTYQALQEINHLNK